ncbi:SIS domain-containing protein, partial [Salmonella enterica]|uniref:SIS domain-containing protein n=1 Tax=Salmonella enterica TaxID=28901 RepID=UPI00398C3BF8
LVGQAAGCSHNGNTRLSQEFVVITPSNSSDTKKSVAVAEWYKAQGIGVVAITKNADSPLAQAATWHIPMRHKNGVEYEYMLLYWLFFRVMTRNIEFASYDRFRSRPELLPAHRLKAQQKIYTKALRSP